MNKILVVNKPLFISSNRYLNKMKKKYDTKKVGFSGTLDPFATGTLILAFGQYTKLFRYLKKTPKKYKATIWLGATSDSLDIENISNINKDVKKLSVQDIENTINNMTGEIEYIPPKYSAKKIDGKRAYDLARSGLDVAMKKSIMKIFDIKLLNYNHPFISFEACVSEGSYIRSLAQIICDRLNVEGTLSYLYRLSEGEFKYDGEKSLDILKYIDLETIDYSGDKLWLELGKKLDISYFDKKEDGEYLVVFDDFFSVISIGEQKIKYILNNIRIGQ